jgi:hypothetical protein
MRECCRDRVAWLAFITTYKTAGTAKLRGSRTRHLMLWVGSRVGKSPQTQEQPHLGFPEPRFWIVFTIRELISSVNTAALIAD